MMLLEPLQGHRYRLAQPFRYRNVQVPAGFVTNGANIPRPLWIVWPPNRSDFMKAVVVHDYLCDREKYALADELFRDALQEAGAHRFTVWAFFTAVDLYHRIKYPSKPKEKR
jgi:hypothetical protein